jgi:putative DNA modification/repair radical SAM protein
MDLAEKVSLLGASARYDASCASVSGDAYGALVRDGVYQSWTENGRRVCLLKVLYSNVCRFDCAYCVNRASADRPRASFTVDELVELTTTLHRRGAIEGLFLSSGIFADVDIVMEKLIATARKLRTQAGFGGYIHLKIIPGADEKRIREAGRWANRISINLELPTDASLQKLAPQKSGRVIFGAMGGISAAHAEAAEDRPRIRSTPAFAPSGYTTQIIVGATDEDDRRVMTLSGALYRKFGLTRVYYSAFRPVGQGGWEGVPDSRLPLIPGPPIVREHRLYQADWLLRFYHFSPEELFTGGSPNLDLSLDPKTVWALNHLDFFPVEINAADYEDLLRVPGVGATSARRIVELRRSRALSFDGLRRLGVVLKRARYFISSGGAYLDRPADPTRLRRLLANTGDELLQLPLFDF